MKSICIFFTLALFTLASVSAFADCAASHGTSDPHHTGKISGMVFKDMDGDNSGGVSFEEFKAVFPRTTQAGFNRLDKDGDHELTQKEWEAFKDAHKGMGSYKTDVQNT